MRERFGIPEVPPRRAPAPDPQGQPQASDAGLVIRLEALRYEINDLVRSVPAGRVSEDVWMGLRSLLLTSERLLRMAERQG